MTTASANLVPVLMEANLPASEGVTAVPEGTVLTSFAQAMECATAEPAAPASWEDASADSGEARERSERPAESIDALVAMVAPLVFMPPIVPVVEFAAVPEQAVALDGCTDAEGAEAAGQCPAEDQGPALRLVEECYSDSTSCSLPPVPVPSEAVATVPNEIVPRSQSVDFKPAGESSTKVSGVADNVAATSNGVVDLLNQEDLNVVPEVNGGVEASIPTPTERDAVIAAKAPRVIEKAIGPDGEGVARQSESARAMERRFSSVDAHFAAPESEKSADPAGTCGAELAKEVNGPRKMELFADRRAGSAPVTPENLSGNTFQGRTGCQPVLSGDSPDGTAQWPALPIDQSGSEDSAEEMSPSVTPRSLPNLPANMPLKEAGADHLQFVPDERGATVSTSDHANVASARAGAGLQAVERTVEAIATQAVQIRHQGSESLSMVVRPDEKTEVRIDLHLTDGQIEAQVFLNHGDRESFTSQWADLHDRLQQQGVRLAPLEDRAAAVGSGQSQHFSQHREPPPAREVVPPLQTASFSRSPILPTQTPARSIWRGILECYA